MPVVSKFISRFLLKLLLMKNGANDRSYQCDLVLHRDDNLFFGVLFC